jgi:hypothetical protein
VTKVLKASTGMVLVALAACSSSSNEPTPALDAGVDAAAADSASGVGAPDASNDVVDAAPFVPPTGTRQLVAGPVALIGSGPDSCANETGATGDRWCAFVVPTKTAGRSELWVLDATRVAAGADVKCDGTDPSCVRIATDALHLDSAGSLDGGFAGDTLLYRRGPDATLADGPIWAWRPGWASGRELVTGTGTACFASPMRATVFCLASPPAAADGTEASALTAGDLDDPAGGPLALVDTIVTHAASDTPGDSSDLELGFSPDGAYVAWSTTGLPSAQGLKVQKIGDTIAPLSVTTGVSHWQMSGDGAAWLWLRGYMDDIIRPSGTLETAAFPAGAGVTTLATGVGDYQPVGDKGVLYLSGYADQVGALRYMPDRAAPETNTLLDTGVRSVVTRSADASTVIYSKVVTAVGEDLFAWAANMPAPCTLTSTPSAFSFAKLMAADHVVVWAQRDVISQAISGAETSLASCETKAFGPDLLYSVPANDDRLLYLDGASDQASNGTLRVAGIGGGAPSGDAPLQRGVDAVLAPVAPNAVLYTIASDASGGLYVYAGALLGP